MVLYMTFIFNLSKNRLTIELNIENLRNNTLYISYGAKQTKHFYNIKRKIKDNR